MSETPIFDSLMAEQNQSYEDLVKFEVPEFLWTSSPINAAIRLMQRVNPQPQDREPITIKQAVREALKDVPEKYRTSPTAEALGIEFHGVRPKRIVNRLTWYMHKAVEGTAETYPDALQELFGNRKKLTDDERKLAELAPEAVDGYVFEDETAHLEVQTDYTEMDGDNMIAINPIKVVPLNEINIKKLPRTT